MRTMSGSELADILAAGAIQDRARRTYTVTSLSAWEWVVEFKIDGKRDERAIYPTHGAAAQAGLNYIEDAFIDWDRAREARQRLG